MTNRDTLILAARITDRWPSPPLDEPGPLQALRDDMTAARVTLREATAAVTQLAAAGERYQPRSPAILRVVNEQREAERRREADREAEQRARQRALEDGQPRTGTLRAAREVLAHLRRES